MQIFMKYSHGENFFENFIDNFAKFIHGARYRTNMRKCFQQLTSNYLLPS